MNYSWTVLFLCVVLPWSLDAQVIGREMSNAPVCMELPDISITYSFCEDFESMSLGDISPQGNPNWTLFNGSPSDQAFIVSAPPFGQGQALMFGTYSDVDLNLDRMIQTNARLQWKIFFPTDKTGDWGLETNNSLYALSVSYEEGVATIYESGSKVGEVAYPSDQWLKIALVFQPEENQIEFWMEGQLAWTLDDYQSHLVTDLNFYYLNWGGENEFYVDDLIYYEVSGDCNQNSFGGPVCVNNVMYSSASEALCAGYTDMEWTDGDCLTAIEDFSPSNVLRIYPNPVRNTTTAAIEFVAMESEGRLEIYSSSGELMYLTDWSTDGATGQMRLNVDIESWVTGLYLVCISTKRDRILEKLVVIED